MIANFTVIGVWDDGSIFAERVECSCPYEAMQRAALAVEPEDRASLQIVGAVPAALELIPPCEDSASAASAADLVDLIELCECGRRRTECTAGDAVDAEAQHGDLP